MSYQEDICANQVELGFDDCTPELVDLVAGWDFENAEVGPIPDNAALTGNIINELVERGIITPVQ
jgi:hypothetical protein